MRSCNARIDAHDGEYDAIIPPSPPALPLSSPTSGCMVVVSSHTPIVRLFAYESFSTSSTETTDRPVEAMDDEDDDDDDLSFAAPPLLPPPPRK
jgi:hypothetical protein